MTIGEWEKELTEEEKMDEEVEEKKRRKIIDRGVNNDSPPSPLSSQGRREGGGLYALAAILSLVSWTFAGPCPRRKKRRRRRKEKEEGGKERDGVAKKWNLRRETVTTRLLVLIRRSLYGRRLSDYNREKEGGSGE